jgi:hypothetical protein
MGVLGEGLNVIVLWPGICTGTGIGEPERMAGLTSDMPPCISVGLPGDDIIIELCTGNEG